jgi:hypothetical protein
VNKPTDDRHDGSGVERVLPLRETTAQHAPRPVLAVVSDLFFVSRIRETGRLTGVTVEFARTPGAVEAALVKGARFVLVDLTAGYDYDRVLAAAEVARVPVLGFTTHALARETQPWHARCRRVVTKETLTQELPVLLREGVGS